MPEQVTLPGIDPGLSMAFEAYLSTVQPLAMQLVAVIDALNAVAFDEARRTLATGLLDGAADIAGELNHALDATTVAHELGGA